MKLYNFTRLINKYSCDFSVSACVGGDYKDGIWQESSPEITALRGAIVPLAERKIYQSGGAYTAQDRQLYMLNKLPDALKNGRVIYQGNTYSIEEETDYSEFGDVYIYLLKRVNVNDKQQQN